MMRERRPLRGDHNQCPGCGELFNSTFAFEKHRVGEHGISRRCLTVAEMRSRGMLKNASDFWVTEGMPNLGPRARKPFTGEGDTSIAATIKNAF